MEKSHSSGVESPKIMSLESLKEITKDYSNEIGRGVFGVVYKGVLQNGEEVAVKKLEVIARQDDSDRKEFEGELVNLWRLRHDNIVRLIGYCYETKREVINMSGMTYLPTEDDHRLLCFEYMHNGSLRKHLYDESCGHDWLTRYKIIKGICKGLEYLHTGLEEIMHHLDIKPENILLDKNMVPKLADFGLSKFVQNNQTQVTPGCIGTPGYRPPEYIDSQFVSDKYDIYSLGVVMIEIILGSYKGYSQKIKKSRPEFIQQVCEKWRRKLQGTLSWITPEAQCHQVKRCIEIALDCIHEDRTKRPSASELMVRLQELEPTIETCAAPSPLQRISVAGDRSNEIRSLGASGLVDVYPLEHRFRLGCDDDTTYYYPINLSNRTDHTVGVWVTPISLRKGSSSASLFEMMDPNSSTYLDPRSSSWVRDTTRMAQEEDTLLEVVMVVLASEEELDKFRSSMDDASTLKMDSNLVRRVDRLNGEVHRAMLRAIVVSDDDPPSCHHSPVIHSHKYVQPNIEGPIECADVHPTETLILLNLQRYLYILNYETQETVLQYDTSAYSFESVKFIAREQWFATGDTQGRVRVYAYAANENVKEFDACGGGECVSWLAVHPTDPILLTASSSGSALIRLWDWSNGWRCTQTFDQYRGVNHLAVNPWDTDYFLSAGEGFGKVWKIHYSPEESKLEELWAPTSFLYSDSHRHLLVARSYNRAKIWDFDTKDVVHKLWTDGRAIEFACYPTLPLLAITTKTSICLWNARIYRLEKVIELKESPVLGMVFTGTKDLTRLVVPCEKGITILEINLPTLQMDD